MASDRGIDWMYQGPASKEDQQKADEEAYLLGKEFNPTNIKTGDLAIGNESSVGISRIVDNIAHHRNDNDERGGNSTGWNQNFSMRHEDPMFMVNQSRREKEKDQRKKRELFEKAAAAVGNKRSSPSKREGGSNSRSSNRRHRERSSSIVSSSDDARRRRRKKKDKKHKKRKHKSYHSSSDSDDNDTNHHHHRHRRNHKHRKRGRSRSYSMSPSPERRSRKHKKYHRRERSQSHDNDVHYERQKHSSRHERSQSNERHRNKEVKGHGHNNNNRENDPSSIHQPKVYGLISSSGISSSSKDHGKNKSLGPDEHLLAKKMKEKEDARNRYKRRDRHNDNDYMTKEERQAALDTMQTDANKRIEYLSKSSTTEKPNLHDEELSRRMNDGSKDVSSFVHDVVMQTHGFSNDKTISLTKHVAQNRNNIQKANDERFL